MVYITCNKTKSSLISIIANRCHMINNSLTFLSDGANLSAPRTHSLLYKLSCRNNAYITFHNIKHFKFFFYIREKIDIIWVKFVQLIHSCWALSLKPYVKIKNRICRTLNITSLILDGGSLEILVLFHRSVYLCEILRIFNLSHDLPHCTPLNYL